MADALERRRQRVHPAAASAASEAVAHAGAGDQSRVYAGAEAFAHTGRMQFSFTLVQRLLRMGMVGAVREISRIAARAASLWAVCLRIEGSTPFTKYYARNQMR